MNGNVDQKMENLLNLALDATPRERELSPELEVGFDPKERRWDLIIKYSGELESRLPEGARLAPLSGGYGIVRIAQDQISALAELPQIEYIEKPKRLFFSAAQGRTASCMNILQIMDGVNRTGAEPLLENSGEMRDPITETGTGPLLGEGVLVAVIDSGVDYTHPDFCNPDGSSRILAIWDQSIPGNPPEGFYLGTQYTKAEIDEALRTGQRLPTRDISGHGTQVLGIAAGNGRASLAAANGSRFQTPNGQRGMENRFGPKRGVAPLAHILVVKLAAPVEGGFPRTTELMQGLEYVYQKAEQLRLPVAVNLSFGNVYGPHNGTGLLEMYITRMSSRWKSVIVVGTGNEGEAAGHVSAILDPVARRIPGSGSLGENTRRGILPEETQPGVGTLEIELGVTPQEPSLNVQLWKSYADQIEIFLEHPSGDRIGPLLETLGSQRYRLGNTELLIFYGKPSPYSVSQEIYFDFIPAAGGTYVDAGIWRFRLTSQNITDGRVDMWLPATAVLGRNTRFYQPSAENTLTIPSTARGVIAVGAYDSRSLTYAPFSGRGSAGMFPSLPDIFLQKPDLAAPGVNIETTSVGGGYTVVTGTSFAAPFVTGAAAMLMQWGIVKGNDSFLYGEKVKAYLRRGARPLPGFEEYPNNQVGYGGLCVRDSIPV